MKDIEALKTSTNPKNHKIPRHGRKSERSQSTNDTYSFKHEQTLSPAKQGRHLFITNDKFLLYQLNAITKKDPAYTGKN